jgi:ABC-type transporter Mla MlaB component
LTALQHHTGNDVGLFSIFKGKKVGPETPDETRQRVAESARMAALDTEAERARQREIARATAAKIDAIEEAMADDIFNTPEPAWGGRRTRTAAPASGDDTAPMLELATTELLADDMIDAPVHAQTAPVIEEIAIMYANNQLAVAEAMLLDSLADVGRTDRTVWWMLFDLYQAMGRQDAFDNVAIDYASLFETSPPTWTPPLPVGTEDRTFAGVTPTETFVGALDTPIEAQLQRLVSLTGNNKVLRLEFGRVKSVTPEGCALLLTALNQLRKAQVELIVGGVAELADLVRSTIEIGDRDASESPWLLLLALLQLMNREKDFEETAMDYCVTYEVSPPSFEPPSKVATAAPARVPASNDRFMLPIAVEGATAALFDAIDSYAAEVPAVLIDCARLTRVDYSAASALLERLRPIAEAKKPIEFRELNHLTSALFKLLGYPEVARLFPHKY